MLRIAAIFSGSVCTPLALTKWPDILALPYRSGISPCWSLGLPCKVVSSLLAVSPGVPVSAVDDHFVIQVCEYEWFHLCFDDWVHGSLESGRGCVQSERHYFPLKQSWYSKSGVQFTTFFHRYLPVTTFRLSVLHKHSRSWLSMWSIRGAGYASRSECSFSCL